MITSTVKFSQIEDRIDAIFYRPDFLEAGKLLESNKYTFSIGDIAIKVKDGPGGWNVSKEDYTCSINGVPFLGASDIKEGFINLNDVTRIYREKHKELKASALQPRDVLLSVRGTPGFSAVVPEDLKDCNISAALVLIRLKSNINPVYVSFFLSSKYGVNQTYRLSCKTVQPDINLTEVRSIKIPIPPQSFQQKIEKMVKEAQEGQSLADEKYKEAERILNKELGLEKLGLSTQKTFETRFSEINERIDPEYYQLIFNEIEKVFKKQKNVNLGDISLKIKYGTSEDLFYVEKGTPFLRVTDINKFSNIEPEEGKFINNFDAGRLKEYQVETDDIIISRTGTLGLAVYIHEKLDGAVYGSYFIKVKPRHKDLYNRFIAFFISSEIGRLQTNRRASGGIQTNLTIDAIKSIRIPILSRPIQQRICSLIQDSLRLRKETENLLNEAKQKVEKMVVLGE